MTDAVLGESSSGVRRRVTPPSGDVIESAGLVSPPASQQPDIDLELGSRKTRRRSLSAAFAAARPDELDDPDNDASDEASGLEGILRRTDTRPSKYTAINARSPLTWRQSPPPLLFTDARILVVVTMYNESKAELTLTLRGIIKNIQYMCKKLGNPEFWRDVAIVIVVDGRDKMSSSVCTAANQMGLINSDQMNVAANQNPHMGVHLFESVPSFRDETGVSEFPPVQIMFTIKESNHGKIHSHWWFFEGFAYLINPEYVYLLDVGTKPRRASFYIFLKQFAHDPTVAGACGQITVRGNPMRNICNPFASSQLFEYKVASVLDKSFESSLGFLSVLPGAFSAYRFEAIQGHPIRAYFRQLFVPDAQLDPFTSNMMLAEDRVLCFELVAKPGCNYILKYLNTAIAETDVPAALPQLMKQRRRWLNGAFFALLYSLSSYSSFYKLTTHSPLRKLAITYEFFFYTVSVLVQWFSPSSFLLIVVFMSQLLGMSTSFCYGASVLFIALIALQFALAIVNDPVRLSVWYNISSAAFGVYFLIMIFMTMAFSFNEIMAGRPLIIATVFLSWGIYIVTALMHGETFSLVIAFPFFMFLMPTYLIMFPVFAFSNVHDVSWGTKDLDTAAFGDENAGEAVKRRVRNRFLWFRFKLLSMWILTNIALAVVVLYFSVGNYFLGSILAILLFMNGSRFFGSIAYLLTAESSSSYVVKVALSPLRLCVWVSIAKLPLTAFVSVVGLLLSMMSFISCPGASVLLLRLAKFDMWYSHEGTSTSVHTCREQPDAILTHFGLFRPILTTSGVAIITVIVATIIMTFFSTTCFLSWFCGELIRIIPGAVVASIFACNVAYAVDFLVRRSAERCL